MGEIIFLAILGLAWVVFATIQDLKSREIADWLNFSLIIFALGYRFFYSLFSLEIQGFNFFYQGLFGLGVFFVLGNIFYYSKLFAGGDAKLLIALGPIVAVKESFFANIETLLVFLMVFLLAGAIYTLFTSAYFASKNFKKFKKEFKRILEKRKKTFILFLVFSIGLLLFGFYESVFLYLGILVFIFPWLYGYSKAVDESSMIKLISPKRLKVGDWIYKDVKLGKKTIKSKWGGLSKKEIKFLQKKNKKVKIREGVPFGPVFLISYLIYFLLVF